MGFLLNPARFSLPEQAQVPFNTPLYWFGNGSSRNGAWSGKHSHYMTNAIQDSRQFSATWAVQYSNPPTPSTGPWPGIFECYITTWADRSMLLSFHRDTGRLFLQMFNNSNELLYSENLANSIVWADGVLRRCAIKIDLDNHQNSRFVINGVDEPLNSSPVNTGDIRWAACGRWGILTDPLKGNYYQNASEAAGDGAACLSFSNVADLNIDNVFDANGYFTNPGKHFLNWYSTRPPVAFYNAPIFNQGYCHQISGYDINEDDGGYLTANENRWGPPQSSLSRKTVNEGIA